MADTLKVIGNTPQGGVIVERNGVRETLPPNAPDLQHNNSPSSSTGVNSTTPAGNSSLNTQNDLNSQLAYAKSQGGGTVSTGNSTWNVKLSAAEQQNQTTLQVGQTVNDKVTYVGGQSDAKLGTIQVYQGASGTTYRYSPDQGKVYWNQQGASQPTSYEQGRAYLEGQGQTYVITQQGEMSSPRDYGSSAQTSTYNPQIAKMPSLAQVKGFETNVLDATRPDYNLNEGYVKTGHGDNVFWKTGYLAEQFTKGGVYSLITFPAWAGEITLKNGPDIVMKAGAESSGRFVQMMEGNDVGLFPTDTAKAVLNPLIASAVNNPPAFLGSFAYQFAAGESVREFKGWRADKQAASLERATTENNIREGLSFNERTLKYGEVVERGSYDAVMKPTVRMNMADLDESARLGRQATVLRTDTMAATKTDIIQPDAFGHAGVTTTYDTMRTAPTQEPLGKMGPKDYVVVVDRGNGQRFGYIVTEKGINTKPVQIEGEYFNPSDDIMIRHIDPTFTGSKIRVEPQLNFEKTWTKGMGTPEKIAMRYEPYYSDDFYATINNYPEAVLTKGDTAGAQKVSVFAVERPPEIVIDMQRPTHGPSGKPLEFVDELKNKPVVIDNPSPKGQVTITETSVKSVKVVSFDMEKMPQHLKDMLGVQKPSAEVTAGPKMVEITNTGKGVNVWWAGSFRDSHGYRYENLSSPKTDFNLDNREGNKNKDRMKDMVSGARRVEDSVGNATRPNLSQPTVQIERTLQINKSVTFDVPPSETQPTRTKIKDSPDSSPSFRNAVLSSRVVVVSGPKGYKTMKFSSFNLPTANAMSLEKAFSQYGHASLARGPDVERAFRLNSATYGLGSVGTPAAEFIRHVRGPKKSRRWDR